MEDFVKNIMEARREFAIKRMRKYNTETLINIYEDNKKFYKWTNIAVGEFGLPAKIENEEIAMILFERQVLK
jgi:hypothetical protein